MAGCDYHHCEVCGKRTFYDAHVEYPEDIEVVSLCKDCIKNYKIIILPLDLIEYK